jgi:dienelactone hydrolase
MPMSLKNRAGLLLAPMVCFAAHADDLAKCAGNYTLGDGVIAIAEWEVDPGAPHVLAFTDFSSGRLGVLTASPPGRYTLGAGVLGGAPAAEIECVERGGHVTGVTFTPVGGQPELARRIAIQVEDFAFEAGGRKFAGTLTLPPGKGPFPAVVIVPAGRLNRTASAIFPNFFVAQGFAVLAYDARSEAAALATYAHDAVAAVTALQGHKAVDPRRIGLWGHSQGGWLGLVAAAESDAVAFVIDHSGMLVPAWQQELYRLSAEATANGMDPYDVAAAVGYETAMMEVARTGQGWKQLQANLARAGKAPWLGQVYRPASLEELQRVWKNDYSFDPRPYAAKVRQPVLALFGGLDRSTPIESAANLVNARAGRPGLTVKFFPTADHAFLDSVRGSPGEIPALTRFVPGMFDAMHAWLRETAGPRSRR